MLGPWEPVPWECGGAGSGPPVAVAASTFAERIGSDLRCASESESGGVVAAISGMWLVSRVSHARGGSKGYGLSPLLPPRACVDCLHVPEQAAGVEHIIRVERLLDVSHQIPRGWLLAPHRQRLLPL